jgi:NADH:ubiquinone oxidoreductase subunit K
MSVGIEHFLVVSAVIFCVGLYVAVAKRSAVGILMGIELMFNSINLSLVTFSRFTPSPEPIAGQVFALFVITVAAAEAAVALALTVAIYRVRHTSQVDEINVLKW